jgi:hypothetical protein
MLGIQRTERRGRRIGRKQTRLVLSVRVMTMKTWRGQTRRNNKNKMKKEKSALFVALVSLQSNMPEPPRNRCSRSLFWVAVLPIRSEAL